jgi:hypothetical protein
VTIASRPSYRVGRTNQCTDLHENKRGIFLRGMLDQPLA